MAGRTEEIWKEFSASLRRFICSRVRNEQDTEDILQEVFCKIHDKIGQLEDSGKLQAWVYRIARNAIVDFFRKQKSGIALSNIPDVPGDEPLPPSLNEEVATCLRPMIDGLPEKYREALRLTDIQGMSQKELAEYKGLSLSGAKTRVARGRNKLKEALLSCCHFGFDRSGNIMNYEAKEKTCRHCAGEGAGDERK